MNCGLCGLNESVLLLRKGTWEDNKSSQFEKLLPFHSLGSVLPKKGLLMASAAVHL